MPSKSRILLPVMLTVLLAIASTQNVFAAVIDQKQENYDTGTGIYGYNPMGQEFVPTMNTLNGVELRISYENPGSDTLTVNIRSDLISGPILATASVVTASTGWISFTWSPLRVTIGSTYVIQLIAATQGIFEWLNKNDGNPYSKGRLILSGVPQPDADAAFRTYGSTSSSVGGVVTPTNTLAVMAPYLALIGLVVTAAVVVKKRRN